MKPIKDLLERAQILVRYAREVALTPEKTKPPIEHQVSDVAAALGVSAAEIRRADSVLPTVRRRQTGRVSRRYYTDSDIRILRLHLRPESQFPTPWTVAIAGYKGGSAKSTTAISMAHGLASRGYRVLIVDTDPQATTSQVLLAASPDLEVPHEQTLAPLFFGETAIYEAEPAKTNWELVDLIPASQDLNAADYMARENSVPYSVLHDGLAEIKQRYDGVILDTPPTLSMLSMAPMYGADAMICPIPPRMPDIQSAESFFSMASHYWDRYDIDIPVIAVLATMVTRASAGNQDASPESSERRTLAAMRQAFGPYMIEAEIMHSAVTARLASNFRSVYETDAKDQAWKRAQRGYEDTLDDFLGRLQDLAQNKEVQDG